MINDNNNNTIQIHEIKYTLVTFANYLSNILFHAFKKHGITISFITDNKIERILHPKDSDREAIAEKLDIYKIICDYDSKYIYIYRTSQIY